MMLLKKLWESARKALLERHLRPHEVRRENQISLVLHANLEPINRYPGKVILTCTAVCTSTSLV